MTGAKRAIRPMPDGSIQITLELEGLPQERGHLRLKDLVTQLGALRQALHSVDRIIEEQTQNGIYYRVVALSHSSPVRITLEPVGRPRARGVVSINPQVVHDRFFQELGAISRNEPVSPEIDNKALESFKRLVENQGKSFSRAILYNSTAKVALDETFNHRISTLLSREYYAFGSLTGRLETINLHGRKKNFRIYPEIGPSMVICSFMPHLREKAKEYLDNTVTVQGRKAYRPNSNFPYRIEVRDMDLLKEPTDAKHLVELGGIAKHLLSDKPSNQTIREERDEWE